MQKIAAVPPQFQEQDIRWVVLEEDTQGSGGVFLYLFQNLNEACDYDRWFETKEEAEQEAQRVWGISKDDWKNRFPSR